MIPILFDSSAIDFTTFGIGALADTISCQVTEERNGSYECVLKYPVTGRLYSEIHKEKLIKAKPNDTSQDQAFRIYRITKPINGIITIYAQHITYDLANIATPARSPIPIAPQLAMNHVFAEALTKHNFTFRTDYATEKEFSVKHPKSIRSVLGGEEGSLISLWGGEFEWDNFQVIHHQGRGSNTGVVIEYGKNLKTLEQDADITSVYTDLLPYAVNSDLDGNETVVTLDEPLLPISDTTLVQRKTLIKDFTDSFQNEEAITKEALREKAQKYIENNPLGSETPSLTISFEPLWKQPDYAAILERVSLCDRVTIKHAILGIEATAKVIKTVYDTLAEKYVSITLGSARSNLMDTVSDTQSAIEKASSKVERLPSLMASAIQNATNAITGQTGGYVVLNTASENGQPYELLIMDAPKIEDAINIWRWNVGGLGFSKNGYYGPYETAITADGRIVADFITAGTLAADIIKAGIIRSSDDSSYWNIETGEIVLKAYATTASVDKAIDTVEERAATIESNLSGLTSTVSSVTKRVTTSEQNIAGLEGDVEAIDKNIDSIEGNIDSIEGNIDTIESNVSTLEQTASAISARVTTNETNISSLTVSSGQIATRVTTAEGNISSLTQTATSLATRISTAEGDISSVEQNVSSITTRVATAEGNISSIKTDVSGIKTRVSTAEGDISEIEQNVSSITTRVSTAEGNITSLTTSVSGITARVATAEGDISSLETNVSSITARVSTAEGDISSLETSVSGITTRVSSAEGNITTLTQSVTGLTTRVSTAEGNISTVTQTVSALSTRLETAEGDISTLEQTATSLSATVSSKVSSSGGSSSSFGWSLTSSGFTLYASSKTVMSVTKDGLSVSGSVTASSGTIGGFTIGSSAIYKTKTAYNNSTAGVYVGTDGIGLGAGSFYVTSAGYLYASSGKIGGMSLNASQMFSQNFILGTVYDANDSTKSFTTLSFGTTSGNTFSATTILTNSSCYMYSLASDYIVCGVITATAIKADSSISSTTGFYFGYSGGSTTYQAKLTWDGQIIYLNVYNESGQLTKLAEAKSFTVHYAVIWGNDKTWTATVAKGSSGTSIDTDAFWGIDYATFNYSSSNKSQHTLNFTVSGTSAATTINCYGHLVPWSTNNYDFGSAAYKWRNIYGQAGIVNTSDRNEKFDILPLADVYGRIFDRLTPVSFKFVDNSNQRTHIGLVAQDVKDAVLAEGLTTKEFAGYCEWTNDDKTTGCGLRYSEFVAMNIHEIQKLKARIKELEAKINKTEETHET